MKKHHCQIRKISGGLMGALMMLSGTVMPYQGAALTRTEPVIGWTAEAAAAAAETADAVPAAATTAPATTAKSTATTAKPAATTAKPAATTAKPAATTAKPAATTAAPAVTAPAGKSDGFVFGIEEDHAVLKQYTGAAASVTVPASYQGVPVTEIELRAFQNNKNLTAVEIPASVKTIGSYAFMGCDALAKVTLSEGLEALGYYAFQGTPVTEIFIPASLKETDEPFNGCKLLSKVTFGKGITKIPDHLFENCSGLTTVTIPETVTEIGSCAFQNNKKLTAIEIPANVKKIGGYAFMGCDALAKVTLSEGLETLGYYAFNSTSITEICIPATIKSADEPFVGCKSLSKVTFGKGITKIPDHLFENCSGLTTVTIPETVTEIGSCAFQNNKKLTAVKIPANVKKIGGYAFMGCDALAKVTLSEGLETLGYYAFQGTPVTEICIPATIKSADEPFVGCKSLSKVTFGKGITKIPDNLFENCSGLTTVTIPETVTEIGSCAFQNNKKLTAIEIPANVKKIGGYAFMGCDALAKVTLSEGLETLGYYAFQGTPVTEICIPATIKSADEPFVGCKSLSKVTFGKGSTKIPDHLFENCSGLTTVTIPETVTEIGSCAFQNNKKLTAIEIPANVKKIGGYAFMGCDALAKVTLSEGLESLGYFAFNSTPITEICIPATIKSADEPFAGCSALSKVTFRKGITKIPQEMFSYCSGLTEITVPETVKEIGTRAFASCKNLKKVTLSEGLETLGYYAFQGAPITEICIPSTLKSADEPFAGCSALSKVTFGKGITKIPQEMFSYCSGLTEITVPETVKEIGTRAFASCKNLKKVTLSEGLETLGYYAFQGAPVTEICIPATIKSADEPFAGCSALSKVTFGKGITKIPQEMFSYCSGLTEITVPETVKEIGTRAFASCKNLKKVTLFEGLETLGYYAFQGTPITEIIIPSTLKSADEPFAGCKDLTYAHFAEDMVNVPANIFQNAGGLESVQLASTTASIGEHAFDNCRKLSTIYPEDLLPAFRNTTFSNCDQLYDPRFSPLDRTASGITVNSSRSSVNGLMHFTVKYKLDERTADPVLNLSMPETLVLVPESVTGTDPDMTVGNKSDSFQLKALEGTLHFSARMQAAGSAKVQAGMNFKFQNSAWTQTIGTLIVDAPALTVGAPEQVNGLTAPVNGIAGREQPVEIYVNDTLAETVTADAYTGKYRVTVQLPQGDDGAVYQIYAKTAENKTDAVAVTYSKNAPTVQNVWMNYNGHAGKDMDITAVLLEGKSPVISYNPAYPLRFTVKADNSELIDRMFVTSTKGDDIRYLEAFYDAENDVWVTENSFFVPENHSYVPGSLNISILEKEPDLTVSEEDADAYDKMMHLPDSTPQAYRDNSTVNVLAKTDSAFVAEVNFTDGTEDHEFVYCSERTNTVMLDGVTVTAEEIAKDPEKYGYHRVPASAVNGDENCVYYQRWDTGVDDLIIGLSLEALTGVTDALVGEYTGYSLLERIEGDAKDTVEACFVNNFVVATGQNFFNSLTGDVYGDYANYLRIMGDSVHLVSRLYEARDNEMQQCAAVMLFAAQVIVDSGGLELMLLTCGVTAPVAFVVTVGSCVLLTYAGTWLDEWIAGDSMFSSGGILRFIIDPSGIVYEAVLSNPVEDAEVRIYYRDPETGKQTEWNAADYEQENPLRTDTDGAYAWDVPEGEWKVTASKEGYEKAESDWMTVPPVRTDVGLALVDRSAPAIAEITEQQNGLLVQFSKFADIATADEKSIVLKNAKDYAVKPVLHAEGDAYTDQFLLEGDFAAGSYTLAVTEALRSYAGTPAAAAEQTFTVKLNALQKGDIDGDGIISVVDAQLALVEYVTVMSGKDGTFSAAQTKAGDIDGSGSVGVDDAQNILMYYVENRVAGKTVSWEELLERQNPAAA